MKSVGEVMSIGRTFKESLQKAIRSLEIDRYGFEDIRTSTHTLKAKLKTPHANRVGYIAQAFRDGMTIRELFELTYIDPWFLHNIKQIIDMETQIKQHALGSKKNVSMSLAPYLISKDLLSEAKGFGFSDKRIAELLNVQEIDIRHLRQHYEMRGRYMWCRIRCLYPLSVFDL